MALSADDATYIVRQFGIDVERPLLLQVSRFDPWKDPLGVVDVYRRSRPRSDVQLALIGSMATDDPEGWEYLEKVIEYAGGDPDVFVLCNLDNVGSVEINAFQCHADVVMQKSTREGFGLTVTRSAVESAADDRRRRRRHPPADRGRRDRLPGALGAECAERCLRDSRTIPEAAAEMALRRQGARAAPLPHAASAARRPAAVQPAGTLRQDVSYDRAGSLTGVEEGERRERTGGARNEHGTGRAAGGRSRPAP